MVSMKRLAWCILLWLGLTAAAYLRRGPVPTVEGPEATDLISKTRGYILVHGERTDKSSQAFLLKSAFSAVEATSFPARLILAIAKEFILQERSSGIKIIRLPEMQETIFKGRVRLDGKSAFIYNLSGPDENGRIVYTARADTGDRFWLVLTTIEWSKHEVIFSRSQRLTDATDLGNPLSLAPKGGHVAFKRKEGDFLNESYFLEIWDAVNKKKRAEFPISQGDQGSWFSDGKRIAYSKDVDHREIPEFDTLPSNWSQHYYSKRRWPLVPSTFIYDLSNNSHAFFHTGHFPLVSFNDRFVLLADADYHRHLVAVASKEIKPIDWPWIREVVALTDTDTLLCKGLPTAGTPVRWTQVYSPFVRTRPMLSIKLVDLRAGEFQTVIDSFEPRFYLPEGQISFGRVTEPLAQ